MDQDPNPTDADAQSPTQGQGKGHDQGQEHDEPQASAAAQGQIRQWAASWTEYPPGQAPEWTLELLAAAQEAWEGAWAPYSRFRVGAAALLDNGQILQASNQENASYPQGLCAERVLLFHIGAAYGDRQIRAIAIAAEQALRPSSEADAQVAGTSATGSAAELPWLAPCGGCRQVLLESEQRQGEPMQILLQHRDGRVGVWASARDLLPLAFDGRMLR
jgi:cytidine deaminase